MKLLLIILYILFLMECSNGEEEDCFCKDSMKYSITEEINEPVTVFMAEENYITLHLTFKNKDGDLNMDYITVKRETYEITKIREKQDVITERVNSSSLLPLGWIDMNLIVMEQELSITPYIESFVADFPIQQMVISSKYISSCDKGTVSWKIQRDTPASVPLNSLGRSRISIHSAKEFSPIININYLFGEKDGPANRSGVILAASGTKLTRSTSSYIIDNRNDTTLVKGENRECGPLIASLNLKTILTNINVRTLDEDYIITLEPAIGNIKPCGKSLKTSTPEGNGSAITITLVVFMVLIIIGSIITIFLINKRKRHKYSKLKIQKETEIRDLQDKRETELRDLQDKKERELSDLRNEKERELSDLRNEGCNSFLPEVTTTKSSSHPDGDDSVVVNWENPKNKLCKETSTSDLQTYARDFDEIDDKTELYLSEIIWESSRLGNVICVQKAIQLGGDINYKIGNETPLFIACKEGRLDVVQILLQAGAETELGNNIGATPLHTACWKGNLAIVKKLLDAGANKYATQVNGNTPLMVAKRFNHTMVVLELQKTGAKNNETNK